MQPERSQIEIDLERKLKEDLVRVLQNFDSLNCISGIPRASIYANMSIIIIELAALLLSESRITNQEAGEMLADHLESARERIEQG